uniref:Glycine receptor subunit alpha-3 n=2 Tax=Cacopsylla melanoneura TaxID=428564 RepID=A0A8D8PXA3_9HEMI
MTYHYLLGFQVVLLALIPGSENHIVPFNEKTCPIHLPQNFTQNHLLAQLTRPCRYNKKHTPIDPTKCSPLKVTARIHVYHLRTNSETNTEFKVQLLLQLHWKDPRLRYKQFAPHLPELIGEINFIQSIWTPHIYLTNERDSLVLGLFRRDMLVSILPEGEVLFSTRLKTTIFCWMQLGKFPFDQQKCHLVMDSWRYNASELMLEWDPRPITIPPSKPYLTEYRLMDTVTQMEDQYAEPSAVADANNSYVYSSLTLTFVLSRQYGFYLMDFYAPSILLVCISWVSFWMAPDAVPGRTILGASTMLTFFQLGIETGSSLPNVSYIRSNDVWFFVCTVFIFLSLAEFAFVNTIWRYGDQKVRLKKPTSKYILRSSVHPHLQGRHNGERRKSLSCQSSPEIRKALAKLNRKNSDLEKNLSTLDLALPITETLPLKKLTKPREDSSLVSTTVPPYGTMGNSTVPEDLIHPSKTSTSPQNPSETSLDYPDKKHTSPQESPMSASKTSSKDGVEPSHLNASLLNAMFPADGTCSRSSVDNANGNNDNLNEDHQAPIEFSSRTDNLTNVHPNTDKEPNSGHNDGVAQSQSVMSMQDIAIWVDNKSKVVFPLAFTLFNATYWGVLYQS